MKQYQLRNSNGLEVGVIDLGATIVSLKTPDRDGVFADIVLGFDEPRQYLTDSSYFGAVVGRYGNRIANALFSLDGQAYRLSRNEGSNHLHGGRRGFDKQTWRVLNNDRQRITLHRVSPDGEEGYPGELIATVTYTLAENNSLIVDYHATTTRPTVVNLTQHSYFNLAGHDTGSVLNHDLMINAERYTEIDQALIPTGKLPRVEGTPLDFRQATTIGARIDAEHQQLSHGAGYDHNWVLTDAASGGVEPAARLRDPASGRTLTIYTEAPGIQFYSGNFLDASVTGKNGTVYGHRSAVALETQLFPDSPNQPGFPSARLNPGEDFRSRTVFEFGTACGELS